MRCMYCNRCVPGCDSPLWLHRMPSNGHRKLALGVRCHAGLSRLTLVPCRTQTQALRHPHDPHHGGQSYFGKSGGIGGDNHPHQVHAAAASKTQTVAEEEDAGVEEDARSWHIAGAEGAAAEELGRADSYHTAHTDLGTRSASPELIPIPSSPPGPQEVVSYNEATGVAEVPVPPKSFGRSAVGPPELRTPLMVCQGHVQRVLCLVRCPALCLAVARRPLLPSPLSWWVDPCLSHPCPNSSPK